MIAPRHRDALADAQARAKAIRPADRLQWARDALAEHAAGQRVNPSRLRFAHQALGLEVPKGCR